MMSRIVYFVLITLFVSSTFGASCPNVDFSCPSSKKFKAHLTFDDGPDKNTERLLWILKKKGVKASFYPLGRKLVDTRGKKRKNSELYFKMLDRMIAQGHVVGSHTYTHLHHFDHYKNKGKSNEMGILDHYNITWEESLSIVKESKDLEKYFKKAGGIYFRLPYGQGWFEAEANSNAKRDEKVLETLLYQTGDLTPYHVGWNIDSEDWTYKGKTLTNDDDRKFLTKIKKQLCDNEGGVMLFHDHSEITSRNLSCLIDRMKKAGHQFVGASKVKDMNNNGPRLLMADKDIGPSKDCSTSSESEVEKNAELLDQLIASIMTKKEYEPNTYRIIQGNIYNERDKSGSLKYNHISTFTKFKTVYSLAHSKEFDFMLQKNNLKKEDVTFFESNTTNGYSIQIGVKK